jgi:type IV secretory pathway TrbL component
MARKVAGRGGARKAASGGKGAVARKGRGAARKGARDDRSDFRNKVNVQKVEAAQNKDGCLPKLFMLALPFLAVGAFLIARGA